MVVSYNLFLDAEGGEAYMKFDDIELLIFWTDKVIEIDVLDREKPELRLLLEKGSKIIFVPRSEKRMEARLGGEKNELVTNLGFVWKLR